MILASLGLGSAAMSRWIQGHKEVFFAVALSLMTLSLFSAIREKKVHGKNTGLIIFSGALVITATLLSYNKVKYGYFL